MLRVFRAVSALALQACLAWWGKTSGFYRDQKQ